MFLNSGNVTISKVIYIDGSFESREASHGLSKPLSKQTMIDNTTAISYVNKI